MKTAIVSLILLAVVTAQGQWGQQVGNLSGDLTGIEPSNADVKIILQTDRTIQFSTTADAKGHYIFTNIPVGKYAIYVSSSKISEAEGFGTAQVRTGETSVSNIEIGPSFIAEKVTISIAENTSQSVDEIAKTVNGISGQEMRERADFTLIDSLRAIPGFRVQQLGGFGKTASIKTRGLRNQDTAVLIDGIRFRDVASITGDATPFLSDFTLTSVSRVEVLRGSGSSLYGTNAIGGVIDFQTPEPQRGWHGQISGAAGGLGLGRFRGNVSKSFGDFGFTSGLSRTVYTKGIDCDDEANNTNIQSKLNYTHKDSSLTGRFFFSDAFARLN
jgi:outer membrane cobalamin receptor